MNHQGFSLIPSSPSLIRFRGCSQLALCLGVTAFYLGAGSVTVSPVQAQSLSFLGQQIAQIPAGASIIYVNPVLGSDGPGNGTTDRAPYRTISYALQQAPANTVVQLAPGSYTKQTGEIFPLVVKPGILLRGDESTKGQTVVIIGGGNYVSPTFASQNVTIRAAENSEIRGISVTNPNTRGTALWVESANPTISNSTFSNSLRDGIFVTGTSAPRISGNVFTQNKGNGISVARAGQGEIRDNIFQDTGFGIAIGGTSTTTIAGNQISSNMDGIVVSNSASPVLRNNRIENNQRDGVVAIAEAAPNLGITSDPGNNSIQNNGRYDLYNATARNTIVAVGNTINAQKIAGRVDFVASQVQPTPGPVATSRFRDIAPGNWALPYIEALASQNIITGFPDGTFRPNERVTRAQFATIVSKAFAPAPSRATGKFSDVNQTFWGYQAIQNAYRGGFLSGYPGGSFRPNQSIPRVQVLVALASGLRFQSGSPQALAVYQDATQIPDYAVGLVAAATQRRIVINYPNLRELNPNREATRAEVAAFVYQALVNAQRAQPITSPYLVNP